MQFQRRSHFIRGGFFMSVSVGLTATRDNYLGLRCVPFCDLPETLTSARFREIRNTRCFKFSTELREFDTRTPLYR